MSDEVKRSSAVIVIIADPETDPSLSAKSVASKEIWRK